MSNCPLETNQVAVLLLLLWNYVLTKLLRPMQSVRGVQMVLIKVDTYSISARARGTLLNGRCFVLKPKPVFSLFLYINSPVYNLTMMVLQRNLLMCLVIPGSPSGSTSVCPLLWSGETLPAYWPVCKFDLILPVLFLVAFMYWPPPLPTTSCPCINQCVANSYCLPNPSSFCKIHCSLSCAVLPCTLVKYIVNRIAYDRWLHESRQRGVMFHIIAWNIC